MHALSSWVFGSSVLLLFLLSAQFVLFFVIQYRQAARVCPLLLPKLTHPPSAFLPSMFILLFPLRTSPLGCPCS